MFNPPSPPARLLVVEDNPLNRMFLVKALQAHGHQVLSAENGSRAVELLRRESFDLVLLDIIMPEMDGFAVLEIMVQDPLLRDIPVLVVSAGEELDSVVRCIEMGAEDYLTKPPNPVLLQARVNACLEKKRLRDQQRKLFGTFTTHEIADQLLAKGFELGGEHVRASAMFCDVRNFTTLAESSDPRETIELLNGLFALIFSAVGRHGGMINQIQGDGVLSFFGAPLRQPDHAEQAVRAAREILADLEEFNRTAREDGSGYPPITIGIGIATGKMVAGYVGTRDRAFFTCLGDTVNLAARLEEHTKAVNRKILIDKFTQEALPPEIKTSSLRAELFKGKTRPIQVYAVD